MLRILAAVSCLSLSTAAEARWKYNAESDPFTDERASTATKSNPGVFGTALIVRCKDGLLESYYYTARYMGSSGYASVRYRFAKDEPESSSWSIATNGQAVFSDTAVEFARQLVSGSSVVIEARDFSDTPHPSRFSLSGSSGPVGRVLKDCKLSVGDPRAADSTIWRRVVQDVDELPIDTADSISDLLDVTFESEAPHGDRTGLKLYKTLTNVYLNTIDGCLDGNALVTDMPSCQKFLRTRRTDPDADYPLEAVSLLLELVRTITERSKS